MTRPLGIGLALALLSISGSFTPAIAEIALQGDKWVIVGTAPANEDPEAARLFNEGYQKEQAGRAGAAQDDYQAVVKKFPLSEFAPAAQYRVAKIHENNNAWERAFDAYKVLLEKYPKSPNFNEAVEAQFKIANMFLEGRRQKVLGIPTLPSMERAREMFQSILKNAPYGDYAPRAQFGIGQTYERGGQIPEAVEAYSQVAERYPDSDLADDAQYQAGYLWLKQSRAAYDQAAALRAQEAFEEFLMRYPDSEKAAQARDNLRQLETKQTSDALEVARFYDKQKNYKAAVIYYNEVISQQANSPGAEEAKQRIEEIKGLVGEDALVVGTQKVETGARARQRQKLQAQVDISARPDYVGPPAPIVPDEVPEEDPQLRTSPADVAPLPDLEPELPQE